MQSTDLNTFFPDKVCINLERRSDRWQRMQARFAHHGIHDVARFEALDGLSITIPASWDDFPGSYACLASHLAVVENAYKNRSSSVLIMEDDVVFHPDVRRVFSEYIKELPDDWDMLFFGALHGERPIPVTEHIVKLTHSLSTYTYALKHTIYEAFIDLNRQALTVLDENTRALQKEFNCYCFMPHLAWVEEDYSDVREERSSLWWLGESLVLWGEEVDQIESKTVAVIFHRGGSEAALKNLSFIVDYFSKQLPAIALLVVDHGEHTRSRSFNRGFELFSSRKEFFIFLDSDLFLTREDVRANLLRCQDHDFASACAEIWDLDDADTARVINNDLRWNYHGTYERRVKTEICQSACFITKQGFERLGGWDENDNDEGRLTSERVNRLLKVYQSPNPARRLCHEDFSRKGAKAQRKPPGNAAALCAVAPLREKYLSRPSPSLHFQVLTELPEIVALTSEWESLLAQSTCNRGFGSVHWFVASCRANPSFRPHVVVARRGQTLAGILPLVLDEDTKEAAFANYLTDYNDAIAAATDLETIVALLRFACSQPSGYTSINLKHLRPDSNCLQAMSLLNQENDFKHSFRETLICYYLQLPVTHDAFLKSKDSRFRKRLKRLQALADTAGLTAAELDPASFNPSQLPDLFLSLHLARRNVKSCFELSPAQNFVIEMAPPLFQKRAIRACVLRNGDRIVAIDLYTMGHNSLCVWNGGFLDEFGYCSPGKLLINEGIKLASALKLDEFDFLRGGEVYKESWVNKSRYIGQLQFEL